MTPTILGRIQTRIFLVATVGVLWTLLIGPALAGMMSDPDATTGDVYRLAFGALVLALGAVLFGEFGVARASELANRAGREIQWGKWKGHFWGGGIVLGLMLPAAMVMATPWLALPALICAGLGMFAYEYAFVMAPQELPNS